MATSKAYAWRKTSDNQRAMLELIVLITLFAPELFSLLCSFSLSLKSAQDSGLPLSLRGVALYPKPSPCSPCLIWIFLHTKFPFLSQGRVFHPRPVTCSSSSDALHPELILPYGYDTIYPNLLPFVLAPPGVVHYSQDNPSIFPASSSLCQA